MKIIDIDEDDAGNNAKLTSMMKKGLPILYYGIKYHNDKKLSDLIAMGI